MEEFTVRRRTSRAPEFFATIFSVFLILVAVPVFAEIVTFEKEYKYEAGEADNKISCRTIALEQVKKILLEELGTYLESETEVSNFQLTQDKIIILTAGIVKVNILEEEWNGPSYRLKAAITADTDEVARSIDALRQDRQKVKELEETRKLANQLLEEVGRLKKELEATKAVATAKEQQDYTEKIRQLQAVDAFEEGYASSLSGDYDAAIKSFDRATEIYPDFAAAYNNRGIAYMGKGDYDQAIRDCSTFIRLSPLYAPAYYARGVAYMNRGDYRSAVIDYNSAIKIDNHYAEAYYWRGRTYAYVGHHKWAADDFKKSASLNAHRTKGIGAAPVSSDWRAGAANNHLDKSGSKSQSRPGLSPSQVPSYGQRTNQPPANLSTGVLSRTPSAVSPPGGRVIMTPNPSVRPPVIVNSPGGITYNSGSYYGTASRFTPGNTTIYSNPVQPRSFVPAARMYTPHYGGFSGSGSTFFGRGLSGR